MKRISEVINRYDENREKELG